MKVEVTDENRETVCKSGERVRSGSSEGTCCGHERLHHVAGELHAAFCKAAVLLGCLDESYRVPNCCCSSAQIENDVPVPGFRHHDSRG